MKKTLLTLATLSVFASDVQAESNVTLYGLIDTGINYVNNVQANDGSGKSKINFASGGMKGSRWGLRGIQDIGNGLKAVFMLENGFNIDTGESLQSQKIFNREAFVGLSGDFGTVTLGRQDDAVADFVGPLTAARRWGGPHAAHPGDIDNLNNSRSTDKSIKYTSNRYDGLSFGSLYSLGGVAGHCGENQIWSVGVSYAHGPIILGAAYLNAKTPATSFFYDEDQAKRLTSNPIYGHYAKAKTLQIMGAGGTFDFGVLTVGLNYSRTEFKNSAINIDDKTITATPTFQNTEANLAYHFAPDLVGLVAYSYTWTNKINANKAKYQQVTASLTQSLSKSVSLYSLVAYQKASGKYASGQPVVAAINGVSPSTKNSQAFVGAGLKVLF